VAEPAPSHYVGAKMPQSDTPHPSVFTCPECHGTLWETREGDVLEFRCRVGHAYSADSLQADHSDSMERALWAALRALEENAALVRRLADRADKRGHDRSAKQFLTRARSLEQEASTVRTILERRLPELQRSFETAEG
jgi:two-component system, chemotaxis family, protein-glutamate methylesterase/glutaminase